MNPGTIWLSLVLAGPLQQAQNPPVFAVEIENVMIDAFVSRRGSPVTGLAVTDFELRDNGVRQHLELVASDTQPVLAVLAFDTSGSLKGGKLEELRAASQVLLDSLRPEDEATLFTFADSIQWLSPPNTEKTAITWALANAQPGGGTAILDALYAALILPPARGRALVVLFTDGADNLSWLDRKQMRLVAERSNAVIHVVSLKTAPPTVAGFQRPGLIGREQAPQVFEYEHTWALRQITETTGGRYWEAESLERLKAAFAAIADAMGKRYVLRYVPENAARPGWHKIELKLRGKKGEVHTRSGYWVSSR